jgi:Skp family chaperone for outer membrane proteins
MRVTGCWMAIACLGMSLTAGCNQTAGVGESQVAGAVAVIDLDAIAQRLGSDKQILDSIAKRQTSLSQQLVDLAKSYNAQIAEQKNKLAAEEGQQADEVTVASWQKQANANLNQVKQQAQAALANHRVQLLQQFRDQIKPAARRVAQQRGLNVIVTKNDSVVFDFTSAADITDAVVDELLASAPPAAAPVQQTPTATQAPTAAPTTPTQPAQQAAAPTQPQRQ